MFANPFSDGEITRRVGRAQALIAARKLDAALFASPETPGQALAVPDFKQE